MVVIDDDAIVLLGLQSILKEWGYEVLGAMSAQQAVEKLRTVNRQPDIILADYRLREGKVGTDTMLGNAGTLPGRIYPRDRHHRRETGSGEMPQAMMAQHGFGLMHKPVTPRQLSGAIERFLSCRRVGRLQRSGSRPTDRHWPH